MTGTTRRGASAPTCCSAGGRGCWRCGGGWRGTSAAGSAPSSCWQDMRSTTRGFRSARSRRGLRPARVVAGLRTNPSMRHTCSWRWPGPTTCSERTSRRRRGRSSSGTCSRPVCATYVRRDSRLCTTSSAGTSQPSCPWPRCSMNRTWWRKRWRESGASVSSSRKECAATACGGRAPPATTTTRPRRWWWWRRSTTRSAGGCVVPTDCRECSALR